MKKLSVTYKAPPGDSKVVEMFGHTFYDGKEETVTVDDRMAEKLTGNKHFKCGEPEDVEVEPQADDDAKVAAAKAEDDAKGTAQGYSPPLRGVQINPPPQPGDLEDAPEPEDGDPAIESAGEATEHEHGSRFRR